MPLVLAPRLAAGPGDEIDLHPATANRFQSQALPK
jgi:hypothetical protein